MTNQRINGLLAVSLLLLFACGNQPKQADDAFIKTLKEKPIEKTKFFISLPVDYILSESEGPDFSVYYFNSSDTGKTPTFSGGIYFGNYPSEFYPKNNGCKAETMKGEILKQQKEWKVFVCEKDYSLQTIVDNPSNDGWDEKIHAFGNGTSREDLTRLLGIFSTLRKK